MEAIKGLIVINGKNHQPSLRTLRVVVNCFRKLNIPTHYCMWSWIKRFAYICTQSLSKRISVKELQIFPFWKSMLNVFLSRWMCPTNTPLGCHLWFVVNQIKNRRINLALHLRVDLSDGRRTFVSEGGNEGADEELSYMDVGPGPKSRRAQGQPCQRRRVDLKP
jgi:hypothetical protein